MTEERLKQANEIFKEIDHIESRLYALDNNNIKFNSIQFGSGSYLGSPYIVADGFVANETIELIKELLKNSSKARLEYLKKQFNEL